VDARGDVVAQCLDGPLSREDMVALPAVILALHGEEGSVDVFAGVLSEHALPLGVVGSMGLADIDRYPSAKT
jgi:hypothetical protein